MALPEVRDARCHETVLSPKDEAPTASSRVADAGGEKGRSPAPPGALTIELAPSLTPAAYGEYLAGQLCRAGLGGSSSTRRWKSPGRRRDPHIRLRIYSKASELQSLRWETLRLPGAADPLLTGDNLTFSRYLDSGDWRPVRTRSATEVRALVAVADPSDARSNGLAEANVAKELQAAREGLGDIPIVELAARGQVTLRNIAARLRDGCDILLLVAHGKLVDGESWLYLEKEDGTATHVRPRSGGASGAGGAPGWSSSCRA
jgi:hypothetical protein